MVYLPSTNEIVIWGGAGIAVGPFGAIYGDGAISSLTSNSWRPISGSGAPSARMSAKGVWTGTEMIVWGGANASGFVAGGGRYKPATNTWSSMQTNGQPSARSDFRPVWTGSEMIVWGGRNPFFGDGFRYNPVTDTWSPMATLGDKRSACMPQWAGTRMLMFGGYDGDSNINFSGPVSCTPPRTLYVYQKQ